MIGDHHQLPPVIKNMAFQKYSNMEQSLFTRFVRLGVPTVDLDAQGRARARLVSLAGNNARISLWLVSLWYLLWPEMTDCSVSTMLSYSLCNLYNWRYKHLGNLPHVQELPEFQVPNPGLTFDYQLINVEDFNGVGESEPNPYFYQVSSCVHYRTWACMYTTGHKRVSFTLFYTETCSSSTKAGELKI